LKRLLILGLVLAMAVPGQAGGGAKKFGMWLGKKLGGSWQDIQREDAKRREVLRRQRRDEVKEQFRKRVNGYSEEDFRTIMDTIDRFLPASKRGGDGFLPDRDEIWQKLNYPEIIQVEFDIIERAIINPAEYRRMRDEIGKRGGVVEYIRGLVSALWRALGAYGRTRMRVAPVPGGLPVGL
jgi:hypothetical protein